MAEQPNTQTFDPDDALRLLDEAWSYFTLGRQPAPPEAEYEDFPAAA